MKVHQELNLDESKETIDFDEQFRRNKRLLPKHKWFELKKIFDGIKRNWDNGYERPDGYWINKLWNLFVPNNSMPQKKWCIHHRNRNPWDNRIINLFKMTKSEHTSLHKRGSKHTVVTKKKISEARKSWYEDPKNAKKIEELGRKISKKNKGKNTGAKNGMYGKRGEKNHSKRPDVRKKISESNKAWWSNPDNFETIKNRNKKLSEKLKGRIPWNKGKKLSQQNKDFAELFEAA